jgi:hypothetical protein
MEADDRGIGVGNHRDNDGGSPRRIGGTVSHYGAELG